MIMERDKALKLVQEAILTHEFLGVDDYLLTDSVQSIGIDSLDVVEIAMLIEDGIVITGVDFTNYLGAIVTVEDMVKMVEKYA